MKVVSFNLRGFADKKAQLEELLRSERPEILCYQESEEYNGAKIKELIKPIDPEYRNIFWSWRRDLYDGTGLILKGAVRDMTESHLPKYIIDHRNVLYVENNGSKIIGMHAPFLMSDHKRRWWNEMLDWLEKNPVDIIVGDLNIAYGVVDEDEPGLESDNQIFMARLLALGYVTNESDGNTWYHDYEKERQLRIDYVLTRDRYSVKSTRNLMEYREKTPKSDHVPVVCEVVRKGVGRPLLIVQFFPYQYHQFKHLADAINADVVYKTTEKEFESGVRFAGQYRTLSGEVVSSEELMARNYDYVVYTSRAYLGMSKIAAQTVKKVGFCIPHSLIGTRYDSSLGLGDFEHLVGIMPMSWIGTKACTEEMETRRPSDYIISKSNPLVAQAIDREPRVKVEGDTLGVILGCLSAFKSYYPIVKGVQDWYEKTHNRSLGVKVKFHPLTDMEDVKMFTEDPTFEILDTQMDKYDFTDSCEYLIGGASSLMTEAWLRGKHFKTGQKFTQFPDRRGTGFKVSQSDRESINFMDAEARSTVDSMLSVDPIPEMVSLMENFEWGQQIRTNPSKWDGK